MAGKMTDPSPVSILVIEFDALQRDLIALTLRRSGFNPILSSDLTEARQTIRERQPQVVLVDLYLPGTNGLDFIRDLRSEGLLEGRSAIALSALGFPEIVGNAIQAGADDFILKPVDPAVLISRVKRHIT